MVIENVGLRALLEMMVILLQLGGVAGLCVSRLGPRKWADRGRLALIVALVGLGFAGGLLGQQDSEFALFAGGTMTVLLIGMTLGGGASDPGEADVVGHPIWRESAGAF